MNENYNDTVLIPLLEKKIHELTTALILAEARLQVAMKEKAEVEQKQAQSAQIASEGF